MASGFTVLTNEHLIRSNLWSRQIKQLLLDDLNAMKFVKVLTEFPDGTTINIPSLGEAETHDFAEGAQIVYNKLDTGNFTFSFDQYKYSANAISEKFKRDSYYAADVISAFVPRQHRALMEAVETRILGRPNAQQTPSDPNTINSAAHRFCGGGSNSGGRLLTISDFAKADYALFKANIPQINKVAVLDPSAVYTLETQTNMVNLLSPQPMWGEVVKTGMVTGFKFRYNIMGFDVYVSNYLPKSISETVSGVSVTTGVTNLFFSAAPGDTLPFIGGFRQMPTVYSEFNKDLQQDEYVTIAEYGFKSYRPENMVVVLTDTAVVV